MNLSNLTPRVITQRIVVDKPTIFLTFPDTNVKIWDLIYNTNFILSNCEGIISPIKPITFLRTKFNSRIHNLELKKNLISNDEKTSKKLKVFNTEHVINLDKQNIRNFYFYDLSAYSEIIRIIESKFQTKRITEELFSIFEKVYRNIKNNYAIFNIEVLMLMQDDLGFLNKLLDNIKIFIPQKKLDELTFYDNFVFASTKNRFMIPILNRDEGKNKYIQQSLNNYQKYLVPDEINIKDSIVDDKDKKEETKKEKSSPVKGIVDDLKQDSIKQKAIVTDDGNFKLQINTKQLRNILKSHEIDDPDILANVKIGIDNYINNNKEKLNKNEAEQLVLKAIHKTIHGTDELKEEYIHNPKLLFNKLKDTKTYKVPLEFPEYDNELIQPKNIIDLDYTCGQHRQKFEFTEAIHKNVETLFKTLENTTNYPVKVNKIEHEIVDDNLNRLIKYKITLQNTAGGYSKPYDIEINIPGLVSERYFKIEGNHYIMKTQQFLKPLTKTDPNEVRLLSTYAIVRIGLKNFKFNSGDINKIIEYVKIKYPSLIKEENEESITFKDGDIIGLTGNLVFQSDSNNIKIELDENNRIIDQNGERIDCTKFEYQLEVLINKMKLINPDESINKSKLKFSYLEIYLGGIRIPLILYLWSQKGLLNTLNEHSIDYEIKQKEMNSNSDIYSFPLESGEILNIMPKTIRQKCLVNGLLILNLNTIKGNVNNPESSYEIITDYTKSNGALKLIGLLTENEIDPITKDMLEFEGLSTNFVNLVSKDSVDLLFKKTPDSLADLSIYRARLSEMIFAIVYKQLKMAHNTFRDRIVTFEDPNAKIEFFPDYVKQNLLTTANILQNTEPFNPIEEIMLSSRVVKTGKGGVPSVHAFKTQHRSIHPSSYGNLGAASTSESSDVGLVNHHTLTPAILNKYGTYGIKELDAISNWGMLSLDEALTPFQNSMDSDRLTMARTHSAQVVPVENSQVPLLLTGAEHIVGQISSSRFIHRAKNNGKVLEVVPNKYISVKYSNGVVENLDIVPRKSRTKRGSIIQLEMNTLQAGQSFKKNDTLAWTKNFNEGIYSAGKNVTVCFMNYKGFCHEDSYVITEDLAENTKRTIVKPINIVIPPNSKVLQLKDNKTKVNSNDVLVEFVSDIDLEDYLNNQDLDVNDEVLEKTLYSQSNNSIKLHASFSGEIVDIKVFLNTKKNIDNKILTLYKNLVKEDSEVVKNLSLNKSKEEELSSLDNIDLGYFKIGGHVLKNGKEFNGANIVYYIREEHNLLIGDKLANRFGSKGVISHIIPKDKEPKTQITELTPNIFISPISIFSRKNIPFLKEIYIGKILYFLQKIAEKEALDNKIPTEKIIKKILGVYQILATEKVYNEIENQLNSKDIRKKLKDKTLNLRLILEPFENIDMKNIKHAAELIDIPLDEKIYIPEFDTYTDELVPVGISHYEFLEHISEDVANIRGSDVYTSLTRQPTKGKSKSGGQSISGQDIYALLSLDANNCLNELLTLRSDDHDAKRKVYLDIISKGELTDMPKNTGGGGTSGLFDLYIRGLGLEVS